MKNWKAVVIVLVLATAAVFLLQHNREKAGDGNIPAFSVSQTAPGDAGVSQGLQASPSPPAAIPASAEDRNLAQALNQILVSKNDNDPRLDRDFNHLSPAAKELFRQKYRELPPEKLNQKGTIVFLLCRNLSSEKDFEFLKEVMNEPPCLSMSDCAKDPGPASSEDLHHDLGSGITLIYPKLVSLLGIGNYLKQPQTDPALVQQADQLLEQSARSNNPRIAQKAAQILRESSSHK